MESVRVLLVEDNDFMRSTIASALRAEGCRVAASVRSSREAVLAARENEIDCAVIDLNLGAGPTGIDLAHALRADHPALGIVILTTYSNPRLLSGDPRPLPQGGVYVVKDDIRSTTQLRETIDLALGVGERRTVTPVRHVRLTDTQMDILRLVASGLTNAEIAKRRVVTERAVETALKRTLRSLGVAPTESENPRSLLIRSYYQLVGGYGEG
jgi:DNA-binding NarL/FixJ family response regulator